MGNLNLLAFAKNANPRDVLAAEEYTHCCCPLVVSTSLGIVLGFIAVNHETTLQSTLESDNPLLYVMNVLAFFIYFTAWTITYIGGIFLLIVKPGVRAVRLKAIGPFPPGSLPAEAFIEVLFGIWACGYITGCWVESSSTNCFKEGTCRSSFFADLMWNVLNHKNYQEPSTSKLGLFNKQMYPENDSCFFLPRLYYTILGICSAGIVLAYSFPCDFCLFMMKRFFSH